MTHAQSLIHETGRPSYDELEQALIVADRTIASSAPSSTGWPREVERLKTMSTVEMMGENVNVKAHVEEWEARCVKAEAERDALQALFDEVILVLFEAVQPKEAICLDVTRPMKNS